MANFTNEYKIAVNNILKDIYGGTEYWGTGKMGTEGIIKPITDKDDPEWSNYNFINTHYTVRDEVVEPFIRQKGFDSDIEPNKSYKDSPSNRNYFSIMWKNRQDLFGLSSPLTDEIVGHINKTRKRGQNREDLVGKALNSLPFLDVDIRGAAGSLEDFYGTDAIVNYRGRKYTAQIKPFSSYQDNGESITINTTLTRVYKQDLLVFSKESGEEYHILVIWNRGVDIMGDHLTFPKESLFLGVNYNTEKNKINYKINN